jgi:hypothetical protein
LRTSGTVVLEMFPTKKCLRKRETIHYQRRKGDVFKRKKRQED